MSLLGDAISGGASRSIGSTILPLNKKIKHRGRSEKDVKKRMMEAAMLMQSQEYMKLKLGVLKIELLSSESGKCEWQIRYSMLRHQTAENARL